MCLCMYLCLRTCVRVLGVLQVLLTFAQFPLATFFAVFLLLFIYFLDVGHIRQATVEKREGQHPTQEYYHVQRRQH